jgi:hypothetical protein
MTAHQDWLPKNHEALNNQANLTFNYLLDPLNRDRMGFAYGMPQGQWLDTDAVPKWQAFNAAFNDWLDPSERTQNKTLKLAEAEDAFKPAYRKLYTGLLKDNPLVTDDDLNRMALPTRHSGRHPAPDYSLLRPGEQEVEGQAGRAARRGNPLGNPRHAAGGCGRTGTLII